MSVRRVVGSNEAAAAAAKPPKVGPDDLLVAGGTPDDIRRTAPLEKLERYAFGWRFKVGNVTFDFQDVEEKRGEIRGEIYLYRGTKLVDFDTNFNLGSSRIRTTFSNRWAGMIQGFPYEWGPTVDQMCATIVQAERELDESRPLGIPMIRRDEPYHFWPLVREGGCSLLFGDGGSGKSFISLWIAMALGADCPVPDPCEVRKPSKVLYLDWEADWETHNSRMLRLAEGAGIIPPTPATIEWLHMDQPLVDRVRAIRRKMDDVGADVVIHDSVSWAAGGSLLDDDIARSYLQAVRRIGGTHLAIAHVSADTAKNGFRGAHAFGSRFWHHGPRLTTYVRRGDNGTIAFLRQKANNDAPIPDAWGLRFEWDGKDGPISVYGAKVSESPDLVGLKPDVERILDLLVDGDELSSSAISIAMGGMRQDHINAMLRADSRFVCKPGGGRGKPSLWSVQ